MIDDDVSIIWKQDEELSMFFDSQASYLKLVLHGKVIIGKIDAEFMFFLALLQHTHKQHFFDLFVGNYVLKMAHTAMLCPCFLLHALQVVGVAAVDANEGILFVCYFFFAEAETKQGDVPYIVHFRVGVGLGLFDFMSTGRFDAAVLRLWIFFWTVGAQDYHIALYSLLVVFLLRFSIADIHENLHVLLILSILILSLQFLIKISLKDFLHELRYSMLDFLALLLKLLRNFLNGHVFVDPADVKNIYGLIETKVNIIDRCREEALAELFEVLFFQLAVDEILEHALMQLLLLFIMFAALHLNECLWCQKGEMLQVRGWVVFI